MATNKTDLKTIIVPLQSTEVVNYCTVFRTMEAYQVWSGLRRRTPSTANIEFRILTAGIYHARIYAFVNQGVFSTYAVRIYDTPQRHPKGFEYIGWAIPQEYYTLL